MNNDKQINPFTRGSQIFMHSMRMLQQGLKTSVKIGIFTSFIWFIYRCFQKVDFVDLYHWVVIGWAKFKVDMGSIFLPKDNINITFYDVNIKDYTTLDAKGFIGSRYAYYIEQKIKLLTDWITYTAIFEVILAFILTMVAIIFIFAMKGRKSFVQSKIRGADLTTPKELARLLRKKKKASDLKFDDLPIVLGSERQHLIFTGVPGTGKTTAIKKLLKQIRKRGEKAIIFDTNGGLVSQFYDESQDYLLNPYDARTENWLPWADCTEIYEYDVIADAIIGSKSLQDPFWDSSAKQIISVALQKTKDKAVLKDLISVLCEKPLEEYNDFFAGTKVSGITDAKADKTMTSIRASITNKIQSLTSLAETDSPFSLKNYVAADNASWMFISSSANQRESLKPLISCWFNVILTAIMERDPTRANKNVWIIVDELPSLEKIPKLKTALAEGRKYGGCVVAGLQNIHQLVTIYGRSEALDLIDQFNSRFIFRVGDQELANISSKMLGSAEISEVRESLSYGANTVRDGVNINNVERTKQLVLPSEITTLNVCPSRPFKLLDNSNPK